MGRISNLPAANQNSVYKGEYKCKSKTHACEKNAKVKIATLAGSSIGIALTVGTMLHKIKKGNPTLKFTDLKFKELDVIKMGAASVLGGLTGGILSDKKENIKAKLKEANLQFFGNILMPVSMLVLNTKIIKPDNIKMPQLKSAGKLASTLNPLIKSMPSIAVTLASLTTGLTLGNKIMNKVNEKVFHEKTKRDVKASDFTAHADDLCFAGTLLLKDTGLKTLMSKILPATFLIAGLETGTKTNEN